MKCEGSGAQFLQAGSGLDERFFFLTETESDDLFPPDRIGEETGAGNTCDADMLDQVLCKCYVVGESEVCNVAEDVVRASGLVTRNSRAVELLQEQVAPGCIGLR